jgi:NAD(P)-dependent dehydrogenase (short-subunit alcohol dehydrogenase family)
MLKSVVRRVWAKLYLNLIGAWYVLKEQVFDRHRPLPNLDSERGKIIVITGGSRGIGFEAVKTFLRLDCRVVIGCRDVGHASQLLESVPNRALARVLPLDLMSLSSVREFAAEVLATTPAVNILVNNAGIMFGDRRETAEGFEAQLATNYTGHWLLAHLLLPALRQGAAADTPARIVNVTSCAHYMGSWLDWDDLQSSKIYSPEQAYGNSKAAQVTRGFSLGRLFLINYFDSLHRYQIFLF